MLTCNQLMTLLSIYRGTDGHDSQIGTYASDIVVLQNLGLITRLPIILPEPSRWRTTPAGTLWVEQACRKPIDGTAAFMTGSRVYGTPGDNSDYDLVVKVSTEDLTRLESLASASPGEQIYDGSLSIRCGRLNLLVSDKDNTTAAWHKGTQLLEDLKRPVDRNEAVALFEQIRRLFRVGIYANVHALPPLEK